MGLAFIVVQRVALLPVSFKKIKTEHGRTLFVFACNPILTKKSETLTGHFDYFFFYCRFKTLNWHN